MTTQIQSPNIAAGAVTVEKISIVGISESGVTTATNLADGAANQIVYQQAVGQTTFVTAPTTSTTYLQWNGSAFTWASSVGPQGPTGPSGANGTIGVDGATGPQGPTGPSNINTINDQTNTGTGYISVPAGTTAQRPGAPSVGMVRYNTTLGAMEFYTASGWAPYGGLAISSVSPSSFNGASGSSFNITGSGFFSGAYVSFITNTGTEYIAAISTINNSTSITATTPRAFTVAEEPLDVKVVTPGGLSVTLIDSIDCGGTPSWTTSAGSLGSPYDSQRQYFSAQLTATDPDAQSITYSVVSGSIPTGMSLNTSTGALTGTPTAVVSDTTYSFTVRAADSVGNNSDRAFSVLIKAPIIAAFSYTGSDQTWTAPSGLTTATIYVWGAGGGGGSSSTGGSGGYAAGTLAVTSGTTYTVIVGGGGGGTTTGGWSGGGGGLSGLFTGSTMLPYNSTGRARSIIIAGGGGGGSGGDSSEAMGGAGGGSSGNNGIADYRGANPAGAGTRNGGGGGTQSAGGAIAPDTGGPYNPGNTAGSDLQGGLGSYSATAPNNGGFGGGGSAGGFSGGSYAGGGGGGGYYGGGGGQDYYSSAGGGGSGYVGGVTGSTLTTGNDSNRLSANNPPNTGSSYYSAGVGVGNYRAAGGHGRVVITY
jgi:hypothetical protein